jgi:hypothetical protein
MPISRPAPVPHDPAAVVALKILKSRVQSGLQKYRRSITTPRPRRAEYASDFSRLARRLCGKSVGIVLGGGGARGIAHLVCFKQMYSLFLMPIHDRGPFEPLKSSAYQLTMLEVRFSMGFIFCFIYFAPRYQYWCIRRGAVCP